MEVTSVILSFSTVFQSYQDDGRVNIKGSVQRSALSYQKESRLQWDQNSEIPWSELGVLTASLQVTVKILKLQTPDKFAIIILKLEQYSIYYSVMGPQDVD